MNIINEFVRFAPFPVEASYGSFWQMAPVSHRGCNELEA